MDLQVSKIMVDAAKLLHDYLLLILYLNALNGTRDVSNQGTDYIFLDWMYSER